MHGGLDHPAANGPRLLLAEHHDVIDDLCDDLEAAALTDNSRDLVTCYRSFEHALLEHMAAEEAEILPVYAQQDAGDAREIRRQHDAIREQLVALGVEVELHAVRAETLDRMFELLHAHAACEDATMYLWAQLHLPLSAKRRLFLRLGRSLRALHRRGSDVIA